MPYICTMQSCEVEKAELRKEIERLRDLLRTVLYGKHSNERATCEICNALAAIEATLDTAIDKHKTDYWGGPTN